VHYTTSCNTQSNAPEDWQVRRPKHVGLIGINKPLLFHLVGVYIIYINDADSRNTPSNTNLEEEEIVDAPGNDGKASMPEQVKRPNPWRKMINDAR